MNLRRVRQLKAGRSKSGPVLYWMSREQRAQDNWALVFAQELSIKKDESLFVLFCLVPSFLEAGLHQYDFMLEGLIETEKVLLEKKIPFFLVFGQPGEEVPAFINKNSISALVTDFDPLKIKRQWKEKTAAKIDIDVYEVDAHNIVPCWETSGKQEYAAYTIRPKLKKLLPDFLEDYPEIGIPPENRNKQEITVSYKKTDWKNAKKNLKVSCGLPELRWLKPGFRSALDIVEDFLQNKLYLYDNDRNDPNKDAQSNLSPYLHFGQVSSQRIVLEIARLDMKEEISAPFLEELIIRRELSDNYCFYNCFYDSFEGFPEWAKNTLNRHRIDKRPYSYTLEQLENAETHDDLWNAAQLEMRKTAKMHGYLRMYWAKKILEWTTHPEEAIEYSIYLNDKYELDGRDPNGYTGIAWCIGGTHDRAWNERGVFGKIRYMSYEGCKRKFDIKSYITRIEKL